MTARGLSHFQEVYGRMRFYLFPRSMTVRGSPFFLRNLMFLPFPRGCDCKSFRPLQSGQCLQGISLDSNKLFGYTLGHSVCRRTNQLTSLNCCPFPPQLPFIACSGTKNWNTECMRPTPGQQYLSIYSLNAAVMNNFSFCIECNCIPLPYLTLHLFFGRNFLTRKNIVIFFRSLFRFLFL